MGSNYE